VPSGHDVDDVLQSELTLFIGRESVFDGLNPPIPLVAHFPVQAHGSL
jgi:hypothetical protein